MTPDSSRTGTSILGFLMIMFLWLGQKLWFFLNWLFSPLPFLMIRVIADFAGGFWVGFWEGHWFFGSWLIIVGFATLASAIKTKKLKH